MAIAQSPVYDEVYRFLVQSPTPEEIIAFRASTATQERVRHLLEINREGHLTPEEQAELDEFESVNHFVSMLKAYAQQQLANKK
ncbi:MAG: hypothetical protein HZC41_26635 [Chloroflexi bacterium]|nr:hypothetical protein [Chloroflexota bacterium]